ncbi:MAG: class I SAM-dependent methyltransferase [Muribaculaceae bacterium]|nr:class I SAM-dependent methyltransferase [Muribaculaceae bacterium]
MDTTDDFRRWLSGIPYEVAFWRSYYGNRRRRRDLFSWSLYGKPCVLDGFDIDAYIGGLASGNPKILDVGCALSYAFGNIICGKPADVSYVDPLAPFYNKILLRYNIERPAIEFGMIECLSGSFAPESVDFIHVRNALDHCADPFAGIIQCLVVLREGGVLYLNHFVNEAQNEAYRGFHQFNLCMRDGRLILWNRSVEIDVTERLQGIADVVTTLTPEGRVVAVITRKAPVPRELYDPRAVAMRMTGDMMTTVEYFHSLPTSAAYQMKRLVSTVGHRTMRLLPLGLLKRIKRIAGK